MELHVAVISSLVLFFLQNELMYLYISQHHQSRVKSRDDQIVSLATRLGIRGYSETPLPPDSAQLFLTTAVKLVRDQQDRAKQEKVRIDILSIPQKVVFLLH